MEAEEIWPLQGGTDINMVDEAKKILIKEDKRIRVNFFPFQPVRLLSTLSKNCSVVSQSCCGPTK